MGEMGRIGCFVSVCDVFQKVNMKRRFSKNHSREFQSQERG